MDERINATRECQNEIMRPLDDLTFWLSLLKEKITNEKLNIEKVRYDIPGLCFVTNHALKIDVDPKNEEQMLCFIHKAIIAIMEYLRINPSEKYQSYEEWAAPAKERYREQRQKEIEARKQKKQEEITFNSDQPIHIPYKKYVAPESKETVRDKKRVYADQKSIQALFGDVEIPKYSKHLMIRATESGKIVKLDPKKIESALCMPEAVNSFVMNSEQAYYMCINSAKNKRYLTKSSDDILSLENICVDCDVHRSSLSGKELQQVLQELITDLIHDQVIMEPTLVIFSGRGLHFYWHLESASALLAWQYRETADVLNRCIGGYIGKTEKYRKLGIEIDNTNTDISHQYRIPGTYNQTSHTRSKRIYYSFKKYNMFDLCDQTLELPENRWFRDVKESQKKNNIVQFKKYQKSIIFDSKLKSLLIHRIRILEELAQQDNVLGERDILVFLYANNCFGLYDDFENKVHTYNAGLKPYGLPEREVNKICQYLRRKGSPLKFKNETFNEWLHISGEITMNQKDRAKFNVAKAKEERNKQIIEMYNKKINNTEIAKQLNISRPTIITVLNQARENGEII